MSRWIEGLQPAQGRWPPLSAHPRRHWAGSEHPPEQVALAPRHRAESTRRSRCNGSPALLTQATRPPSPVARGRASTVSPFRRFTDSHPRPAAGVTHPRPAPKGCHPLDTHFLASAGVFRPDRPQPFGALRPPQTPAVLSRTGHHVRAPGKASVYSSRQLSPQTAAEWPSLGPGARMVPTISTSSGVLSIDFS